MTHVVVNGARLFVTDTGGDRPAVVLSHSLFFDHTMFAPLAALLAPDFRVITYDHLGQGQSDSGTPDTLTIPALTADAAALITALNLSKCHFVGNSLGGFVALHLAAHHPHLLLSATAIGSSGDAETRIAEFDPLVAALRTQGAAALVDTLMHVMFGDDFLADPARADLRTHWRNKMAALPSNIADAAHAVVHRPEILSALTGNVPVLAIAGGQDHAYGVSEARAIAAVTGGQCATIATAGHSVALEAAAETATLLRAHFAR